jgi:SAM-dependent methyltransferase
MVAWVKRHYADQPDAAMVDVGCGNGHLVLALVRLNPANSASTSNANVCRVPLSASFSLSLSVCVGQREAGFRNAVGVDYAPAAVTLAQALAAKHGEDGACFAEADVLAGAYASAHAATYDVVLDKGTYDAISLAATAAEDRARFVDMVATVLRPGTGRLLITSCNWTQAELESHFAPRACPRTPRPSARGSPGVPTDRRCGVVAGLVYHSHVKQPTFAFGGQTGQTTVTVAFVRVL